ncbi:MAG TPA: DPP IV N-terminal domain-containing protein [Terriglobales bacterium]|nr:DPP IV N-terminal domain-containing protein [Terriglobales bacterium]
MSSNDSSFPRFHPLFACGRVVRLRASVIFFSLLLLVSISAFSQGTLDDYRRAQQFLPPNLQRIVTNAEVIPHFLGETSRFWYRRSEHGGKQYFLVDPVTKTRTPLFDHARLATGLARAAHREYSPANLALDNLEVSADLATIRFETDGGFWKCMLATGECTKDTAQGKKPGMSPDGAWIAFVRDYNLWLRSTLSGQEVALTHDGEKDYDYATELPEGKFLIEQASKGVVPPAQVFWSPDSTRLVTYRMDSRYAGRFTTIQSVPPGRLRPQAYTYVYQLPGEWLPRAEPLVFEVGSGKRIPLQTDPIEMEFQGGPSLEWTKDSQRIFFTTNGRAYKSSEFREANPATGATRVVVQENADTNIDPGANFIQPIRDGSSLLWGSERSGWNHMYLYDIRTGALQAQLTSGNWVVHEIVQVDEKAGFVYFLAAGREAGEDPYQTHLYRVGLDGRSLQLLTPEPANHSVVMSPRHDCFIDSYSRPDLPTKVVLRSASNGEEWMALEETDVNALQKTGWRYPESFRGKAADQTTDLYGMIWRPSNFDSRKKYPVIEQIYTGPQGFFVPKMFGRGLFNSLQSTAELGFIVVMIDGRGTAGRSKAFHDVSYKNLGGKGGIDDHIAMLRQMAAKYPYMDLARVGLYGGSAGGYDTVHAMLTHPDFYKVGVSISGNHDHRMDKAWWNELWMGYPVGDHYREQSNVTMADKLQGKLLLIHGDLDDNVNPSATLQLVDALIKANKDFDLLIVPNQYHGDGGAPYLWRRRWDFFVQHLLGVSPPKEFKIEIDNEAARMAQQR